MVRVMCLRCPLPAVLGMEAALALNWVMDDVSHEKVGSTPGACVAKILVYGNIATNIVTLAVVIVLLLVG
jgi:hypothetical protein